MHSYFKCLKDLVPEYLSNFLLLEIQISRATVPGNILIYTCQSQILHSENIRSHILVECYLTHYPPTSKVQRHFRLLLEP